MQPAWGTTIGRVVGRGLAVAGLLVGVTGISLAAAASAVGPAGASTTTHFQLFWVASTTKTGTASTQVQRASLTGAAGTPVTLPSSAASLAVADGSIYWAHTVSCTTGSIGKVALSGATADPTFLLPPNVQNPYGGIAAEAGNLYWANLYGDNLSRSTLAGTNPERFVTTTTGPTALAVDGNDIYWGTNQDTIRRTTLTHPTTSTVLVAGLTRAPRTIAVGPTGIYWTVTGSNAIGHATLTGTTVTPTFVTGATATRPQGIAIHGDFVYWANVGTNSIARVAATGGTPDLTFIPDAGITGTSMYTYAILTIATVGQATTTTVSSSVNPSAAGQSVTFAATVAPTAGSGTPTGTVQFAVDGTDLGSPVTLGAGSTAMSPATTTLGAGADTVTATYSGDTTFTGSTGTLIQTVTASPSPTPSPSTVPSSGYRVASSDGGVYAFGGAPFEGSLPGDGVSADDIVALVPTPTGGGYWLVGADGGVYAFGDAPFEGSLPSMGVTSHAPVVGMAATSTGDGYWLVGADGGVYAFGAAAFEGSLPGDGIAVAPTSGTAVTGVAASPTGQGYWLVGKNGGVYAFGSASFHGSLPGSGVSPAASVVGITATGTGTGYWLVGADGGSFAYGGAVFAGSATGALKVPAVGISAAPTATIGGSGSAVRADDTSAVRPAVHPFC